MSTEKPKDVSPIETWRPQHTKVGASNYPLEPELAQKVKCGKHAYLSRYTFDLTTKIKVEHTITRGVKKRISKKNNLEPKKIFLYILGCNAAKKQETTEMTKKYR